MTKIYIKTWGCSLNKSDSEVMAGLLKNAQFEIVNNPDDADVLILNSCTVKDPSENSLVKEIEEYKDTYKIIIIAGCVPQADHNQFQNYPLIGTKQIHNIVEVVEEALNDNIVCNLSSEENPALDLPKIRNNPLIEIIPICRGCLGECTYCKTRAARGKLISYPIEDIKRRLMQALRQGVKEVWLTAQDCGCYGFDLDTNLAQLLTELTSIPKDFKIRVGMMNPNHLLKIKDQLFKAYQNEKVFKFLHLPIQSGNDCVLNEMKRKYTSKDFKVLVKEFRTQFPISTLATDIIVGFPGVTDQQYWESLNIVRELSPDIVNISRFSARSNTPAAKMKKQVPGEERKRRSRVLTEIFQNVAKIQNEKWIGWEGKVLIDEQRKEGSFVGRNFAYKQIILEGNLDLGEEVKVRVERVTQYYLLGKVV